MISTLQKERDYIYGELLKSNRKSVAQKGLFQGDVTHKSILNEISKIGINSIRQMLGQKVKHVGCLTELKNIKKNIGEVKFIEELPEKPVTNRSVMAHPIQIDQYLQTDASIGTDPEVKATIESLEQKYQKQIDELKQNQSQEDDNDNKNSIQNNNEAMNDYKENETIAVETYDKLDKIAKSVRNHQNFQTDSRNYDEGVDMSDDGYDIMNLGDASVQAESKHFITFLNVYIVNASVSKSDSVKINEALKFVTSKINMTQLLDMLLNNEFSETTPKVFKRLWKEVHERKLLELNKQRIDGNKNSIENSPLRENKVQYSFDQEDFTKYYTNNRLMTITKPYIANYKLIGERKTLMKRFKNYSSFINNDLMESTLEEPNPIHARLTHNKAIQVSINKLDYK